MADNCETTAVPKPKKRRLHSDWLHHKTFPNKSAAVAAVVAEKTWSYHYENDSQSGIRVNYRCNAVKFRSKKQCSAKVYLLYHSHDETVSLYRCTLDHTHEDETVSENLVFKFTPDEEAYIIEMFNHNAKPKAIKVGLVAKGFSAPPASKLESYLKKLRAEKYGKNKLNLGTLEAWLAESSVEPADERDAFVVNYEVECDDEDSPKFRFVARQFAVFD